MSVSSNIGDVTGFVSSGMSAMEGWANVGDVWLGAVTGEDVGHIGMSAVAGN